MKILTIAFSFLLLFSILVSPVIAGVNVEEGVIFQTTSSKCDYYMANNFTFTNITVYDYNLSFCGANITTFSESGGWINMSMENLSYVSIINFTSNITAANITIENGFANFTIINGQICTINYQSNDTAYQEATTSSNEIVFTLIPGSSWYIKGNILIITLSAIDIGTNYATLKGYLADNIETIVWFEYGKNKGIYIYRTDNQTKSTLGNFSQKVKGIQLMPSTSYYFRAAGFDSGISYGNDLTFTTDTLTPFGEKDFDKNYEELKESKFNISSLAEILPKTYTDMMLQSNIFFGLFFGLIFMALWIRSEDVVLPALLGMSIGASIWIFLPPTWMKLAQSLFIVSLAAAIYSLIKGRK